MYRKTAQKACAENIDYFGAIKQGAQGRLYDRAEAWLGDRNVDEADQAHIETRNGETLVYRIWTTKIAEGTLGGDGARQLIRIQRTAIDNATEEVSVGERYFVSSEAPSELDPLEAYRVARAHWRCENEGHWTADAIWGEDARRTPWTKHPTGIINVGILRAIAINILALLRSMSRLRKGDQLVTPGWKQVIEHAFQALLTPALETGDFDAFDN
jgi:predicted transposase YbfD/YdcC